MNTIMFSSFIKKLFLVLFSVFFTFFLIYLLLIFFQKDERKACLDLSNIYHLDKQKLFDLAPNEVDEEGIWETDQFGFRKNPNHTNDLLKSGKDVWLAVGDSFVFGHNIEHQYTWPALLEIKNDVIVHNLGVSGTGSDQQFIKILENFEKYKPKKIFWMINLNDMVDSNNNCLFVKKGDSYHQLKPYLNIGYFNLIFAKKIPKAVLNTQLGEMFISLNVNGQCSYTFGCSEGPYEIKEEPYFEKLKYFIKEADQTLSQGGSQLIVLMSPSQFYFDPNTNNEKHELELLKKFIGTIQSTGVEFYELNSLISEKYEKGISDLRNGEEMSDEAQLYQKAFLNEQDKFPYGYWHPNEYGYSIIESVITEQLNEKKHD